MASGIQVASLFGLLDLQDNMTPGLENAKTGLNSFAQAVGSQLQSTGQTMQQFGTGVAELGAPFLTLGGIALKAFGDDQLAMAQLDAVLKSTGGAAGMTKDQLLKMADSLSSVTRNSKDAEVKTEAMLLTFTNIGQNVFPQALTAVNDVATAMNEPLQSAAIQVGKALNDPVNGMTALQRIGVTFTQDQKDAVKAMMDTGNTAGAQSIILAELTKEFGGSAKAAGDTFPGKLDIMKNHLQEAASTIGQNMTPMLSGMVDKVNDAAIGFQSLPQPVQDTIAKVVIAGAVFALGGIAIAGAGVALSAVGTVVAAGGTLLTGLGALVGFLTGPVGLILLFGALIGVLANEHGGLANLFHDVGVAAQQLVDIPFLALKKTANDLTTDFNNLAYSIGLARDKASGHWDVGGMTWSGGGPGGSGTSGGSGGSGGSAGFGDFEGVHGAGTWIVGRGAQPQMFTTNRPVYGIPNIDKRGGGITITGPITIVANNPQDFEKKLRQRYHGRGN